MFNSSRSTGLCALLACAGFFLLPSHAQAFDLTGAWATSADQCSKVFVKKGDPNQFCPVFCEEFAVAALSRSETEIKGRESRSMHHQVE